VIGGRNGVIQLWDPNSSLPPRRFVELDEQVLLVKWSPDGRRLLIATNSSTAGVWDIDTDAHVTLTDHAARMSCASWSPDGNLLVTAAEADRTTRVWDPATGEQLRALGDQAEKTWSMAWRPDGTQVATGSDRTVHIWDPRTGTAIHTLHGHRRAVTSTRWSPDGSLLATASADGTARIWDPITGANSHTITGHADWVKALAWSPDGNHLATGDRNGWIHIWDRTRTTPAPLPAAGRISLDAAGNPLISVVKCRDETHRITQRDNQLVLLDHDAADIRRERTAGALGGKRCKCVRVLDQWETDQANLPPRISNQLIEVQVRHHHQDTAGLALLHAAGLDTTER
jgi:WD40 repeat protein